MTSIFTTTTPAAKMPLYQCSINDKTLPPTTPSASTTLHFTLVRRRTPIPPPRHSHTTQQPTTTSHKTTSTETPTEHSPFADNHVRSTFAVAPTKLPRYLTRHQAKLQHATQTQETPVVWPPPEEYITQVEQAFQAEVTKPIQTIRTMDPKMFPPAPDNWRQILKLPPTIQTHWANAQLVEIKELIKKKTFAHANPNKDDPIIPVTSKYRVKLSPEGSIDKLKARTALRRDLM
jgi:hypothetical protein